MLPQLISAFIFPTVLGLIIGALFVRFTSWPWVFYFSAIVSSLITLAITILVPSKNRSESWDGSDKYMVQKLKKLDFFGVSTFACTSLFSKRIAILSVVDVSCSDFSSLHFCRYLRLN
jgi:MFS family permease